MEVRSFVQDATRKTLSKETGSDRGSSEVTPDILEKIVVPELSVSFVRQQAVDLMLTLAGNGAHCSSVQDACVFAFILQSRGTVENACKIPHVDLQRDSTFLYRIFCCSIVEEIHSRSGALIRQLIYGELFSRKLWNPSTIYSTNGALFPSHNL